MIDNLVFSEDVKTDIKSIVDETVKFIRTRMNGTSCSPHAVASLLTDEINKKDSYTYNHCMRVGRLARDFSKFDGRADPALMEVSGYIHDVGKLAFTPELFCIEIKRLTPEDIDRIRAHPVVGAEILKSFASLHDTLPVVMYHHERYGGFGYPCGLTGDQIPETARIMAVIDAFDAICGRPYRLKTDSGKWQKTIIFAIEKMSIESKAGGQWDNRIVHRFLSYVASNIGEIEAIYEACESCERRNGRENYSICSRKR